MSFCYLFMHIKITFVFGSNVSKSIANIKSSQSPNYKPAMLLKK